MADEPMTHEVTCSFAYGSITFQIAANFYGDGTVEDGIKGMLESMYPSAQLITVNELEGAT